MLKKSFRNQPVEIMVRQCKYFSWCFAAETREILWVLIARRLSGQKYPNKSNDSLLFTMRKYSFNFQQNTFRLRLGVGWLKSAGGDTRTMNFHSEKISIAKRKYLINIWNSFNFFNFNSNRTHHFHQRSQNSIRKLQITKATNWRILSVEYMIQDLEVLRISSVQKNMESEYKL